MAKDVHTSPVRGMRDLLPQECELRDWAIGVILDTYRRFGFQRVETPALEHLPLLTGGDGGENEKLIFKVLKRGDELESSLADFGEALIQKLNEATVDEAKRIDGPLLIGALPAAIRNGIEGYLQAEKGLENFLGAGLRFDLTVPLARFYAEHNAKLPSPFKSIQIGPVWRAERPQKGRYRQFTQCDIDVLGEAGESAEIDLILATTEALAGLGLSGFTVRINDRRLLSAMLEAAGVPPESHSSVLVILDKLDKIGVTGVEQELIAAMIPQEAVSMLGALLETEHENRTENDVDASSCWTVHNWIGGESSRVPAAMQAELESKTSGWSESLERICMACMNGTSSPLRVRCDPTLVRGMGYYTGPIFEIGVEGLPYSIAGGGRYDRMIGKLLGREVPACGFSIGFERVIALLLERGVKVPRAGKLLALLHEAPDEAGAAKCATLAHAVAAAAALRSEGHAVSLQLKRKKLGKQLDDLQKLGFDGAATLSAEGGPPQVKWFAERTGEAREGGAGQRGPGTERAS